MRLWSLHPQYLDSKGLVALWREGLLALKVLKGKTKGYKHHPQLKRFREAKRPVDFLQVYLSGVLKEAQRRGYRFNQKKIKKIKIKARLPVTSGQIAFELLHLKNKLWKRSRPDFFRLQNIRKVKPHPLFKTFRGKKENWEKSSF